MTAAASSGTGRVACAPSQRDTAAVAGRRRFSGAPSERDTTAVSGRATGVEPAQLLYGRLLASAAAGGDPPEARYRLAGGGTRKLPLRRWLGPVDGADLAILAHAAGPVLDIGCGPGRHLAALTAAGHEGLGLDLSPVAVRLARARGAEAILRDVFADVPRTGRWRTALLLDGNIGIGGAPAALLARARELVARGGVVLVETGSPGAPTRRLRVRLETPRVVSPWFGWAVVGADGIAASARAAGLRPAAAFEAGERWFARLERPR